MINTKFFTFDQNNSGGSFVEDKKRGIGYCVSVEAVDERHALAIAEDIGLYFDGVEDGRDCECCGNRWSSYMEEGDNEPMLYGRPVKGGWGKSSFVHYLDGRVVEIPDESS